MKTLPAKHYMIPIWGQALIANSIITSISLLILFISPSSELLVSFMVALSVGCLLGDAIFHLIPHSAHFQQAPIFTFAGIWVFYLLEKFLAHYHHGHGHSDGDQLHHHSQDSHDIHDNQDHSAFHSHDIANSINQSIDQELDELLENSSRPKPMGYMLIAGDVLHNFIDGMALGASFSVSFSAGLSTSVAILLHEIPHELGDFLILKRMNFSSKYALKMIFFSNAISFLGVGFGFMIFGDWLSAFVAGNFLYISLSDLVPEMLHEHGNNRVIKYLIQNLGILIGGAIIFLIGIYLE